MKKFFKFGCLGFLGLFLLLTIIGLVADPSENPAEGTVQSEEVEDMSEEEIAELAAQKKERDSLQLVEKRKEDSLAAVKKAAALKSLSSFRKQHDDFNNTTFYQDRRTPVYTNRNFIYPYIGTSNGRYWMHIKYQYAADDWLFIDQARIKTDNNDYTINGRFERDNNSGIWEWYDQAVREEQLAMLEDIATSKVAKVRYVGSQYYKDRTLTAKEKDIIKKTIEIYKQVK